MTTARDVSRVEEIIGQWHSCCLDVNQPMAGAECYRMKPNDAGSISCALRSRVKGMCLALLADREAELGRVKALLKALDPFIAHSPYCESDRRDSAACDCGLDAALSPGSGKDQPGGDAHNKES